MGNFYQVNLLAFQLFIEGLVPELLYFLIDLLHVGEQVGKGTRCRFELNNRKLFNFGQYFNNHGTIGKARKLSGGCSWF